MDENYEELRAQLARVRKYLHNYNKLYQEDAAHGLNQEDVARQMWVSQPKVSRLEHGDPPISELARYVEVLGGRLEVKVVAGENWLGDRWPVKCLPTQEWIPRWPL